MAINVQIKPGVDANSTQLIAGGSMQHVITDKERASFGLDDGTLKNAVGKYFGRNPNDAFLKSPTPWDDLYKRYSWPQVQTVLVAQNTELLQFSAQPSVLKTTLLRNTTKKPGNFNATLEASVTNTFETSWNLTTNIEFSEAVGYSVQLAGLGSVGDWSFGLGMGAGGSRSENVTVGSGISVDLNPGEAAEAQLSVTRGVLKARIYYSAYLIGSTAINYDPTWKDHHFWALDIEKVLQAGGVSSHRPFFQDITVGYSTNAEVKLSDDGKMALKATAAPD